VFTGSTTSNVDFPITGGAFQPAFAGGANDAFLVKLDASGNQVWSTYLGGAAGEEGFGVDIGDNDTIYACGDVYSFNFPSTGGAFQPANAVWAVPEESYLVKFEPNGNRVCGTYIGGTGHDEMTLGGNIAAYLGVVYLTGNTPGSYPVTGGAYQTVHGGGSSDVYIAQFCTDCRISCLPILPIELASFTGRHIDLANILEWETASENSNDYFAVERGINGQNFELIGMVGAAGNANTINSYDFIDKTPALGINYYRLKQVDFNGTYTYSKVISISNGKQGLLLGDIVPNPAINIITYSVFTLVDEAINIEILDVVGKIVSNEKKDLANGTHVLSTDITDLPEGVYFLKLTAAHLESSRYKVFIK